MPQVGLGAGDPAGNKAHLVPGRPELVGHQEMQMHQAVTTFACAECQEGSVQDPKVEN